MIFPAMKLLTMLLNVQKERRELTEITYKCLKIYSHSYASYHEHLLIPHLFICALKDEKRHGNFTIFEQNKATVPLFI